MKYIVLKNNNGHIEIVSKHNTLANAKKSVNKVIRQLAKDGDEDALDYLLNPNDERETIVTLDYVGLHIVNMFENYAVVGLFCEDNECNFITCSIVESPTKAKDKLKSLTNIHDTFNICENDDVEIVTNITSDCVFMNLDDGLTTAEYKILKA